MELFFYLVSYMNSRVLGSIVLAEITRNTWRVIQTCHRRQRVARHWRLKTKRCRSKNWRPDLRVVVSPSSSSWVYLSSSSRPCSSSSSVIESDSTFARVSINIVWSNATFMIQYVVAWLIVDADGVSMKQGYAKWGLRFRIRTTKGFPVDCWGPPGMHGPRSFWKFFKVDTGTKSLSSPAVKTPHLRGWVASARVVRPKKFFRQ